MPTATQTTPGPINEHASSGPNTEAGKAISSKNAIKLGLFTEGDFIRPGEEAHYDYLTAQLRRELAPVTVLEFALADEIRRAMWRLHRCAVAESHLVIILNDKEHYILDPMESSVSHSAAEAIQKSVDRARSQAHRLLHKCTAELRRLQTDRQFTSQLLPEGADLPDTGLADWQFITKNMIRQHAEPTKEPVTKRTPSRPSDAKELGRNAPCPCKSGLKYKRCCGKSALPLVRAA